MTRFRICLGACVLALSSSLSFAQSARPVAPGAEAAPAGGASAAGTQVALIDIGFIFRKHPGYVARRDALLEKAKTLTGGETNARNQLQKESNKLKDFQPGSLEYKQLEAQLTQQASDFQVQQQLARRELAEEEVKLYYETYVEVQKIIDRLADAYGIQLVVRFDREPMEATDPDSIRRGLMNPVVYQRGLDITDMVMAEMTKTAVRPGLNNTVRPGLK